LYIGLIVVTIYSQDKTNVNEEIPDFCLRKTLQPCQEKEQIPVLVSPDGV